MTEREKCRTCERPRARSRAQWIDIANPENGHSRYCGASLGQDAAIECRDVALTRLTAELATAKVRVERLEALLRFHALRGASDFMLRRFLGCLRENASRDIVAAFLARYKRVNRLLRATRPALVLVAADDAAGGKRG